MTDLPPRPQSEAARGSLPEFPMLWRGLAFLAASLLSFAGARRAARANLLLAPLALVLVLVGLLTGWAAAIHLSGGETFDDHPWV